MGPRSDYMVKASGKEAETMDKLANHILHVKSSIEAGVDRKEFDRAQADSMYKRFQNAAFDNTQNNALKNPGFAQYEKANLPRLRDEVMRDVEARYDIQKATIDRARSKEGAEKPKEAPRHDLNVNLAATAATVDQTRASHRAELQKNPAFAGHSAEDLDKMAYYRALVSDREKASPDRQVAAITKFDTMMRDPQNVRALPPEEKQIAEQARSEGATKQRDTSDHSL